MIGVGQRIRDYEIVSHLKHGGMAQIYLARRVGAQGFARPVAIKVVHPHMASDELVKMFLDEARLSASIQHPNVVHVEDLGELDGTFFLAMEYLHGESLSSLLAALMRVERALPMEVAVWIASGAAAGLHAAHETCDADGRPLGVVHRDVSPQNVLVSIDGHVKLIDFGVAKMRSAAVETQIGSLKGKLAYMSPEQARAGAIDRRTDIYALGIVLWEMLTMRRLFGGGSEAEVMSRVLRPSVRPPSAFTPGIPPALDAVVLRALAAEPEGRYATTEAFARELARAMPEALASGGPALKKIVRDLLGDRIEARKRELAAKPEGLEPTFAASSAEPDATLVTETVNRREPSLAVMPFRAISAADPTIGEWLSDDLRDVLSRVRGLRVKARANLTDASEEASGYGLRAGVDHVVTGRIHQDPARVRLSVALTNVEDGFQRWSERFDCGMDEVLEVSDRVASAISTAIGSAGPRGEARGANDPEVIAVYGKLRQLARVAALRESIDMSVVDRALELAPRDPTILAVTAMTLCRISFRSDAAPTIRERARDLAERAVDLAPELPEPWMAIGYVRHTLCEPPSSVVRALRRAITSGPSLAEAHQVLARVLAEAGLIEDARKLLDRALWLDPEQGFALVELIRLDAFAGDWERVRAGLERLRLLGPEGHAAVAIRMSIWAGRLLGEVSLDHKPHSSVLLRPALEFLRTGHFSEQDLARFPEYVEHFPLRSRPRRFFRQVEVEMLAKLGRTEAAVKALEKAVSEGLEDIAWLEQCPLFRTIHGAPGVAEAAAVMRANAAEVRRAWDEW